MKNTYFGVPKKHKQICLQTFLNDDKPEDFLHLHFITNFYGGHI